jgi:hypothetical protein
MEEGTAMAQTTKDLSPADAKKAAATALDQSSTTKVTVEEQGDAKWTVTVESSAGTGDGADT